MSIGLVLRHTYEETCEICDKIANFLKIAGKKWNVFFTRVGYARSQGYLLRRSQLASQGYYKECKEN